MSGRLILSVAIFAALGLPCHAQSPVSQGNQPSNASDPTTAARQEDSTTRETGVDAASNFFLSSLGSGIGEFSFRARSIEAANGTLTLSGDATLDIDDMRLEADTIVATSPGDFTLTGNAVVTTGRARMSGQTITVSRDE
jgi:hypothetical protein